MNYPYSLGSPQENLRRAICREGSHPNIERMMTNGLSLRNRDRASEARHGGRFIRQTYNRRLA